MAVFNPQSDVWQSSDSTAGGDCRIKPGQSLFQDAYENPNPVNPSTGNNSDILAAGFPDLRLEQFSGNVDVTRLPDGDGHVVSSPEDLKPGEVYVSPETYDHMRNGPQPGAMAQGPWINEDGTYDSTKKTTVDGAVHHNGKYEVTTNGANDTLTITGNALPSTTTGQFPIDPNSDAAKIDPNPNQIQANDFRLTVPRHPQAAAEPSAVGMGAVGVMTNGELLYATLDGQGNDANKHEVQDNNAGHPSETQHYHAHQIPPVLYEGQSKTGPSPVLGRALDGYPIVAAYNSDGNLYSTSELDKFHGRQVDVVQEDGTVENQWAYCVSQDYPYTIGAFRGTPAQIEGLEEGPPGHHH